LTMSALGFTNYGLFIVKNLFGLFQMLYFQLSVIYTSYRQVLTPVNNLLLLLRLSILDKLRLVTFHLQATQRNYSNRLTLV
jgi:hypothetical protein